MRRLMPIFCLLALPLAVSAEELAHVDFEGGPAPLPQAYGDEPQVLVNASEPGVGRVGEVTNPDRSRSVTAPTSCAIASAFSTESASGFSHNTWQPASQAASTIGRCKWLGVQMKTMSGCSASAAA
jgi:hypothetical protein